MTRKRTCCWNVLRAWMADSSGSIALVFAFCLPVFVLAAGVAVDLSQAYNVKTRLSNALDKAALAAGSSDGSEEELEERVNAFFNANYPPGTLGTPHDIRVIFASGTVDVTASSRVDTVFMRIFGIETIDVAAETIVKREVAGLELVLVMDTTGSMAQTAGGSITKIDAAKTAANTLLDTLFGASSEVETLFVGIVPFSQDVNIGTSHSSWTATDTYNWGPTAWYGCVEARETSGRDITDDPPSVQLFPKYYSACSTSTFNVWEQTLGPELATNGNFSAATGWTLGPDWTIGAGLLSKTAPANIATNGDFSSSAGWTLGTGWTIGSGILTKAVPANIVTNGDFSASTGWTVGSNWAISGGVLVNNPSGSSTSSTTSRTPSIALVSGYQYEVTFTVVSRTAGSVRVNIGGTLGTSRSSTGTFTQTITAGSGTTVGITGSSFRGSVDNFTVRQLTSNTTRSPSSALVSGDQYEVTYTILSRTAGSVFATIGGASGTVRSAPGTFTEVITAGSGSTIGFSTADGLAGTIDNFTVKHITTTSAVTRSPASPLISRDDYLVTYTITNSTSGSVYSTVGNRSGASNSTIGTFEDYLSPSSGSLIGLATSDGFIGSIDNFSVKHASNCGSGPTYYYLEPLDTTTRGPNLYCSQPITPMTNNKSTLTAAIASMQPAGATMINLGLAWGWRMLSPRWRGVWGGFMNGNDLPLDYNSPNMNKVVILMTDGDNTFSSGNYTAYGKLSDGRLGTTSSSTAVNTLNTRTQNVCNSLKANNVLIYTIALGTSFNSTSLNLLRNCATGPAYFFQSPTTADLQNSFRTIANQLNSLYITH